MLLAVDTSTSQVGLGLFDGSRILGETHWTTQRHHTTELAPGLSSLLSRSGYSIGDLSALAVAIGPGSFTSLRVGLAFVKGLALARRIPVIGIRTLDVIASAQPVEKKSLFAVIQAGRGRVAFSEYKSVGKQWQVEGQIRSGSLNELIASLESPSVLAGEFSSEERIKLEKIKEVSLAPPSLCVRRPATLAELAWTRYIKNDFDDAASLAPIYLHVAGAPLV